MNDAPSDLHQDLEALRYLDALNSGDLEAVAEIWERASRDPELRQTLVELDGALFVEAQGNASPPREPSRRRWGRWAVWAGVSGPLAAACLVFLLAWPWRGSNEVIPSSVRNQPVQPALSQQRDGTAGLAALLVLRRTLNDTEMPAFAWPVENTVSTSSPLDLPE
jgi:hypothetical protein